MVTAGENGLVLRAARAYLRAGISVIPIRSDGSKAPAVPSWKQFQDRLPTEDELGSWFGNGQVYGVATIGGRVSGGLELIDFDEDAERVFAEWCDLVELQRPGLVDRLTISTTPRGGFHVRYRCDGDVPGNQKLAMREKSVLVETRGEGGYALAPGCPPSCHKTSGLYEHLRGPKLSEVQTITADERLILIRCAQALDEGVPDEKPAAAAMRGPAGTGLSPGDDFNARGPDWETILVSWSMVRSAGAVRYWRRPGKDDAGISATTGRCTSPKSGELIAIFSSNAAPFEGPRAGKSCSCYSKFAAYTLINHGGNYKSAAKALAAQGYGTQQTSGALSNDRSGEQADGPEAHLTDTGNAIRLVRRHGGDLHYCWPWKHWLFWDGIRWVEDQQGEIVSKAKETIRSLFRWAVQKIAELEPQISDEKDEVKAADKLNLLAKAKAVLAWCLKSEGLRGVSAMVDLSRSEPGIPIQPSALNEAPWLLNCPNGTIDLRTGKLRPHRREDLLTQLCPTAFDPNARAPRWFQFLGEVFANDDDLIVWLQKLFGYTLTGDVREQILPIFWGEGSNGKSLLINTIMAVLGEDVAIKANRDLFMARKHDNHPAQIARLFRKRMVVCTETNDGSQLDEVLVKELTGGDPMAARRMREDWWQFMPEFKAFLITNYRPEVRGTNYAIWRRLRLIPCTVKFKAKEEAAPGEPIADPTLDKQLAAEARGILKWMVEGALAWQRDGLAPPRSVVVATANYRSEQDKLAAFLAECCREHREFRVKTNELYGAFQNWCKRNGFTEVNGTVFGRAMTERGFQRDDGKRWYLGVALNENDV